MSKNETDNKKDDEKDAGISYKAFSFIIYTIMILTFVLVVILGKEYERELEVFQNADSGVIGEGINLTSSEVYIQKTINLENELSQLNNNIRHSLTSLYDDEQKNEELIRLNRDLVVVLAKDVLTWEWNDIPNSFERHFKFLTEYAELHSDLADEQFKLMNTKLSDKQFSKEEMELAVVEMVRVHNENTEQLKEDMAKEFDVGMTNYFSEVGDVNE